MPATLRRGFLERNVDLLYRQRGKLVFVVIMVKLSNIQFSTAIKSYLSLTGESANCRIGLVPGERCGRKGVVLESIIGTDGFSGFISRMLLMPYFIILVCSCPKSPASRPVDDFMCIFLFQ